MKDGNTEKVKYGSATQSLLAVNEGNWEPPFTMLPASQRSGFHSQINAATSCLKETEGLFCRTLLQDQSHTFFKRALNYPRITVRKLGHEVFPKVKAALLTVSRGEFKQAILGLSNSTK